MTRFITLALAAALAAPGLAGAQAITSPAQPAEVAAFDIVRTDVVSDGADVVFTVQVRGEAGEVRPKATGQFAGSAVFSYVWPTSLDSSTVGFDGDQGILALAVTFHPDFDDAAFGAPAGLRFDGVTSALLVNADLHAPLLCISDVFDVASGDLSLPGRVTP